MKYGEGERLAVTGPSERASASALHRPDRRHACTIAHWRYTVGGRIFAPPQADGMTSGTSRRFSRRLRQVFAALRNKRGLVAMVARAAPVPAHTISGFSAGGDMAMIHLVAYSASVLGATVDGGAPYGCNILPKAEQARRTRAARPRATLTAGACSQVCQWPKPGEPWPAHLARMEAYMRARERAGEIEPLSHLRGTPVVLYSGAKDDVVLRPVMLAVGKQARTHHESRLRVQSLRTWHVHHAPRRVDTCRPPD